jgi:hypothetical protein
MAQSGSSVVWFKSGRFRVTSRVALVARQMGRPPDGKRRYSHEFRYRSRQRPDVHLNQPDPCCLLGRSHVACP